MRWLFRCIFASALLLPAAWLVAASYLFLALAGLSGRVDRPWMAWWLYLNSGYSDIWTRAYLILAALLPILIAAVLAVLVYRTCQLRRVRRRLVRLPRQPELKGLEPGVTDNHGHSAWATPGHLAARFSGPGCLIGAADRQASAPLLFDPVDAGPTHSLVISGPGSHKTSSAITRLWHWRGSRVVFDPSCEIGPIMTPALRADGFNVTSIGINGAGIDALDWIDTAHPEADAHIRSAVEWAYNEGAPARQGQARDPIWGQWGRALVVCLAAHMIYAGDATSKTYAALRRGLTTPEADMKDMLAGIYASSNSEMARGLASGLMGMQANETFSGIYANAFAATEWLSVGAYADIVSGSAMRTADILDSKTVVFIQLPLRTLLTTPAVGRAVMGALFNAMFHADGGGIDDRILFLIDEAWVLGPMKEIKLCHTTARKYRGSVCQLLQSEGQLEGIWGRDDAKLMRDTVSWRSYNAIQDGDVAEKLSRDLGEHAVLAYSEGTNTGKQRQPMAWMGSSSRGDNVSTHEIKRRLIKADEIMRAPADEMWVLARDFPHPIRCATAPYFRYPELAALMAGNRFAVAAQ
jgi:type IV secretion system protein VirD4